MRIARAALIAVIATVVSALPAKAELASQVPTDRAYLTFPCPARVPGAQLAAGTYLFVIADSLGGQSLIDVYTADASRHIVRFLGVAGRNPREAGAARVANGPNACPDRPQARRGWYPAPDAMGIEFVYDQVEAAELSLTMGVRVPYATLPVGDIELLGAYPVAGLSLFAPVVLTGAGSLVPLPSETSPLGLLAVEAGSGFGPQDHLTAARLLVIERARAAANEREPLTQLLGLLDALQRASRGRNAALTERLARGVEATLANLNPPAEQLARRGILPPPRAFVLMLEQVGAHVRAFKRGALNQRGAPTPD